MVGLNRREFLITVGAAGAGAMLAGPGTLLAATGRKLFQFAIINDTHLGSHGVTEANNFATIVGEINASPADFTACLGDLVNAGPSNESQYPTWKGIADQLTNPWYAVQGNHDPAGFFTTYLQAQTDFVVDHKGYRFIFYNNSHTDSHNGFLTNAQLTWIGQEVDEAKAKGCNVILMCHVTAHVNLHPDRGWWLKDPDGGTEFKQLLDAGKDTVVAIFNGHHHCGVRGWSDRWDNTHEVVMPAVGGVGNVRNLTGAPGWYLGPQGAQPNGYTEVEVYQQAIILRYKPTGSAVIDNRTLDVPAPRCFGGAAIFLR